MTDVYFKQEDFDGKTITVVMTWDFYIANNKHKYENGQANIQEVNVISPSGNEKVFKIRGWYASGIRYKHENLILNIVQ